MIVTNVKSCIFCFVHTFPVDNNISYKIVLVQGLTLCPPQNKNGLVKPAGAYDEQSAGHVKVIRLGT